MADLDVGGVRLFYERAGAAGRPLVLVHGSWVDHGDWAAVVPDLARDFRVVSYDRRGHSRSERPAGQGHVGEDVDDLAALIQRLDLGPAHVVANSFGAGIALRLACRAPDLLASLNVHEPPLFGLIAPTAETGPLLARLGAAFEAVVGDLARGEIEAGTRRFVEDMALGPGAWDAAPQDLRRVLIDNAPTFLDEARDPDALAFDVAALQAFDRPLLLTGGSQSPPHFAPVLDVLAQAMPHAQRHTFQGAGHLPHQTHPAAFAARARAFAA